MKFRYMISIGLAAMLSLGSLIWMSQTEAKELNTDFKIETLNGDEEVLQNFELSAITKSGQNEFSKVIFNGKEFSIEETIYDERNGLDGEQLANRELYRHMNFPSEFETEDYIMTTQFDFSYMYSNTDPTARIAVKTKETGEIRTEEPIFSEISNSEWVMDIFIVEKESNFYYILTTDTGRAIVYLFNPDTLAFQFEFEHQFESENWGNFVTANQALYFIPSATETGGEIEINSLNLDSREVEKQVIPLDNVSWISSVFGGDNHFILEMETGLYLYDEKQGSLIELKDPSFLEALNSFDGFDFFSSNHSIVGNYAIINYETHSETGLNRQQYIAVYDIKTQESIYEGRIPLRNDQGLISSFSVRLAQ